MTEAPEQRPRRAPWRDWRFGLGLAISVLSLAWVVRGVPLGEVWEALAGANWWLLMGLSLPAYGANIWVRALRWRHLTNPVAVMPRSALVRAQAVGFAVNNLVPLRLGELVRSWLLAREAGVSPAAILGTVVIERVLDVASVLLLAGLALALLDTSGGGGVLAEGARLVAPVGLIPLGALVALRLAPGLAMRVARIGLAPFPDRLSSRIEGALERFLEGLEALSGGRHLLWIAFHTATVWLVLSPVPVLAVLVALDIPIGGPWEALVTAWILLAATGVAVAVPSAPGFIGPFQLAYVEVLERLGTDAATALAAGMLAWVAFWISLTLPGVLVLGRRGAGLAREALQSGKDPSPNRR